MKKMRRGGKNTERINVYETGFNGSGVGGKIIPPLAAVFA